MYVQQFFIDGLGCASYLIGCEGAGIAAVVDPDRDVQKYLDAAQGRGLKITHIIETHLHADHVSGNTDLAIRTGAAIYLHEASGATFAHQVLKHGDVLALGNVRLHVRHTPGHTPESITLLVADTTRAEEPWLALTGDTLFVGDAGRPDLVGIEAAQGLAGQLYESLNNELLPLQDGLLIYPGHGAGSLCGRSIGSVRSTTLGFERLHNPALAPRGKAEFIDFATHDLPEQPGNHQRIKSMNRRGPNPLGDVTPRALSIHEAIPHFQRGAALLDTRPKADYVQKHVPGSVHLEADDQLSNRVGFVLPADVPLVLIVEDAATYRSVVYSLARVGYENIVGYLGESLDTWQAMGLPVTGGDVRDIEPAELSRLLELPDGERPIVVDVREPWEYRQGHVPGSRLIPLGDLMRHVAELDPAVPVAVICASGSRSQSAAALLGQKGFATIYNVLGGTSAWMMNRLPLDRSN
jgi:hydroxyacylglutathione hydrolase